MSERFNWDGSPKDDGQSGFSATRTMWLHKSNRSMTLRRDELTRCRYCGLLMEYFDRYDHGRIPMVPKQLPSAPIPHRMRWHILSGAAWPGDGGEMKCYVPHPAFCPAVEHDDDTIDLAQARAIFRKHMERRIEAGLFVPVPPPSGESEVAEQFVEPIEGMRHVIAYGSLLWLAPGEIDHLQCVARARRSGKRCTQTVSGDEGKWTEIEIPYAPGRAGQEVLWAGATMWVYALHTLYSQDISRWMRQRCTHHAPGENSAPDAVPPQWVHFDPLRHDAFILRQRPASAGPIEVPNSRFAGLALGPKHTDCATPGCGNGSEAPVADGWKCRKCERTNERRQRTHQRWINPTSDSIQ
ncbi:DUF6083 domain-containing protein [Streptomyces sp. NPDC021749]|uniref:DUF6083 domain-containing protein n=1 Tax=Streptomyces sp. NPDC021749 TaxID=3154905 RepID=UPI0033C69B19